MKKLLIAIIALLSIAAIHAEESTVVQLRGQMPFVIPRMGQATEIVTPEDPIVLVFDISETCTPEQMEYFRQNEEMLHKQFILAINDWDETMLKLAKTAYHAGVPFALKYIAECDPEGSLILFSTTDLETMFNKPQ